MTRLFSHHGGLIEICSKIHFRNSFLNVASFIPDLITSGSMFHRLAPRTKKALFDALRLAFGTLIVLRRRWLNIWPSIGFLSCSLSARYLGYIDVTTLNTNIRVWNAQCWFTEKSPALLRRVEVGVSRPSFVFNLAIRFWITWSRRLSSFVKDVDLRFSSSKSGMPQTLPKSWMQ